MFPFSLQHRIAYLNIYSEISFSSSVTHWQSEYDKQTNAWKKVSKQVEPIHLSEGAGIELDADCIFPISAQHGGVIHIAGDLNSNLYLGGHHEVIISGNVAKDARIEAAGFHRLFVGGAMRGEISSSDGSKIWIENDFVGSLKTGAPSTSLNVGGDFIGSISPYAGATLLWMTVKGFASQESMIAISNCDYTVFDASIGLSDTDSGFYPIENAKRQTKSGHCTSHWSVGCRKDWNNN
ncbi:MAG: hypothetical protein AAGD11_12275 [Planctomycetota bacterium]